VRSPFSESKRPAHPERASVARPSESRPYRRSIESLNKQVRRHETRKQKDKHERFARSALRVESCKNKILAQNHRWASPIRCRQSGIGILSKLAESSLILWVRRPRPIRSQNARGQRADPLGRGTRVATVRPSRHEPPIAVPSTDRAQATLMAMEPDRAAPSALFACRRLPPAVASAVHPPSPPPAFHHHAAF
jgi:hypothetical protein